MSTIEEENLVTNDETAKPDTQIIRSKKSNSRNRNNTILEDKKQVSNGHDGTPEIEKSPFPKTSKFVPQLRRSPHSLTPYDPENDSAIPAGNMSPAQALYGSPQTANQKSNRFPNSEYVEAAQNKSLQPQIIPKERQSIQSVNSVTAKSSSQIVWHKALRCEHSNCGIFFHFFNGPRVIDSSSRHHCRTCGMSVCDRHVVECGTWLNPWFKVCRKCDKKSKVVK